MAHTGASKKVHFPSGLGIAGPSRELGQRELPGYGGPVNSTWPGDKQPETLQRSTWLRNG